MRKRIIILALVMLLVVLVCGCTIKSGVFIGFNYQSSDTSLEASYLKFDGSLLKRVPLKEGDTVTFSYEGDDELQTVVKKGGEELCGITDGSTFTAQEDGNYDFTAQGNTENGAFSLSWEIQ